MDEFAYAEPPPTKNPRDHRRTPGGSSGGSAAAVAAGICDFAIGSQTLQSTIVPAAYCGVVGFKSTFGRIPFDGVALSWSLDAVGLIASSMSDLRHGVAAIGLESGQSDRPTSARPARSVGTQEASSGWVGGCRSPIQLLRAAGFEVRPTLVPWNEDLSLWAALVGYLLHKEMAQVHAPWFDAHKHLYRPRTRAAVERGRSVSDGRYDECKAAQAELANQLEVAVNTGGIDCWICPAVGTIAPIGHEKTGDSWMTSFWSFAGLPCLTLPVFDGPEGMPFGLQCVAPKNLNEELLVWAEDLECPYRYSSLTKFLNLSVFHSKTSL